MSRTNSWKIPYGTCGIYMITNLKTNDFYIGSSCNIPVRLTSHFNAMLKRNSPNKLYLDIRMYGKENFKWELLEECTKEMLIEKESFYYETLKPTYNILHPKQSPVSIDMILKEKMSINNKERDSIPIDATVNGIVIHHFNSISEASDWINKTYNTSNSSKSSNICKSLKDKIGKYYGYIWRYSKV